MSATSVWRRFVSRAWTKERWAPSSCFVAKGIGSSYSLESSPRR